MKYFNKRLLDSGIKKKYHSTSLKDFKDRSKKVIPVIRKYLLHIEKYFTNGTGLFIHGRGVSGKTLLANIVALYVEAYGFSVLFTKLSDLTASRIDHSDDSFEKAKSVEFLFLDGVGKGSETASYNSNSGYVETLHALIKERDGNVLPTIITTRLDLEGLDEESVEFSFGDGVSTIIKLHNFQIECVQSENVMRSMQKLMEGD